MSAESGNAVVEVEHTLHGSVGSNITIKCHLDSEVPADWRLFINATSDMPYIATNGRVYSEFRDRFQLEGNNLVIVNAVPSDSVVYVCIEDAGYGKKHYIRVNVTGITSDIVDLHRELFFHIISTSFHSPQSLNHNINS